MAAPAPQESTLPPPTAAAAAAAATKRLYDDSDDGDVSDGRPNPKRAKKLTGAQPRHHHQNSAIDPTWGQKYVFSGLGDASTIPYGDESDFEDDTDAMAYLRSIGPQLPPELRQQCYDDDDDDDDDGGPAFQGPQTNANTTPDAGAWYEDGAYVAGPADPEAGPGDGEGGGDEGRVARELHEAYFASILDRYRRLRRILHSRPPAGAAARLSSAHPTAAAPFGRASSTIKIWSRVLRNSDPRPLQLALMSKDSVLRVLRVILDGKFLRRGYTLSERTSHWLWALLARLPDPGQLDHTDMAWVRDLGRRAVLLGRSLAEMAALRAELEDGALGSHEAVDASSSSASASDDDKNDNSPDPLLEAEEEPDGGGRQVPEKHSHPAEEAVTGAEAEPEPIQEGSGVDGEAEGAGSAEEGEVEDEGGRDGGSVEMDLSSGSDDADGRRQQQQQQQLEAARRALLTRLDAGPEPAGDDARAEAQLRLRVNMRATLDMVLTVAGDFYGQRDLLEFREPFIGL
ncbi:hypothetical protein CDD83_7650 [Cordyceps sp. RAO-2017]|nr:hypothetical protein CDD83_7650 [Cordyceps sp. RAO-2017]